MKNIEEYAPKIHKIGDNMYVEMLINAKICPICKKNMIKKIDKYTHLNQVFPLWSAIDIESQMKRAKLVYSSNTKVDDKYICCECEKSGKADFLCALCNKRKPSNKIKESFGDPEEFLCSDCYNTKTAKEWHETYHKLSMNHRWDFE